MDPPKFLTNLDNPCWIECLPKDKSKTYPHDTPFWNGRKCTSSLRQTEKEMLFRNKTWRLRCMPKFYLIGLAKCGTTEVFALYVTYI